MSKRRLARPGLSYFDINSGRLVTQSAELMEMKRRIRERWPDLDVAFDHVDRKFLVIQRCQDGVERLFMTRTYCDERLIADIAKCDPANPMYIDPEQAVDDHNAQLERAREQELEDIAGDFGERLIHALKADGYMDHEDVYGGRVKPKAVRDRSVRAAR